MQVRRRMTSFPPLPIYLRRVQVPDSSYLALGSKMQLENDLKQVRLSGTRRFRPSSQQW